ncbi:MAG TPA: sodium/proton-translocating pyrophosphatase, partial [Flavobacteriales bacterium]|nr:sodium/proton-translocating pyrophosphatase [Flavobacteriales bacterium]
SVVGDTVGDPFKDTSGPSLNILLKLISVVALVIASSINISSENELITPNNNPHIGNPGKSLSESTNENVINALNNDKVCGTYGVITQTMIEDIPSITNIIITSDALSSCNNRVGEVISELSKGQQVMFQIRKESSATHVTEDIIKRKYPLLQVGVLKIGDKEYNANLYFNAREREKLHGKLIVIDKIPGLEKETVAIFVKQLPNK